MAKVTDKDIQDWFDSGPIKEDVLNMWLEIIQNSKDN